MAFGLNRGGRVLLGDEMGLGKTLQVRRIFRLLQLRKFVGRKRCHDDEYETCYLYIIYIYTYGIHTDDSDATVIAKISLGNCCCSLFLLFWYSFLI